jgi:hypothetical protein
MNQSEALEAAKLAAMVGGQMKMVDQFTTHRTNNPANKINMNNFVAKVKNPGVKVKPAHYLTDAPSGFAPPPSEEYIQSMVPDVRPSFIPSAASIASESTQLPQTVSTILPSVTNPNVGILRTEPKMSSMIDGFRENQNVTLLTRSDVDSIRNSLKNIDKSLQGMLKYMQESSKPKVDE